MLNWSRWAHGHFTLTGDEAPPTANDSSEVAHALNRRCYPHTGNGGHSWCLISSQSKPWILPVHTTRAHYHTDPTAVFTLLLKNPFRSKALDKPPMFQWLVFYSSWKVQVDKHKLSKYSVLKSQTNAWLHLGEIVSLIYIVLTHRLVFVSRSCPWNSLLNVQFYSGACTFEVSWKLLMLAKFKCCAKVDNSPWV